MTAEIAKVGVKTVGIKVLMIFLYFRVVYENGRVTISTE